MTRFVGLKKQETKAKISGAQRKNAAALRQRFSVYEFISYSPVVKEKTE